MRIPTYLLCSAMCLFSTAVVLHDASAQIAPISEFFVHAPTTSGNQINRTKTTTTLFSHVIRIEDASSFQIKFGRTSLPSGTKLRMTSYLDGGTQHLNATTLRQWNNKSAWFNGSMVLVELIAQPNSSVANVTIEGVMMIEQLVGEDRSICGSTDDRELSYENRDARAIPIGCTAWIINDSNHTLLTAGHCTAGGIGDVAVIEFNVPVSDSNGNIQHPGPEDQYSSDPASLQSSYSTIGNDWAYFGCFPNTETGLTPFQAQNDFYVLSAAAPSVNGQQITITGFGVTSSPVSPTYNQAQKTHTGPYAELSGTSISYQTDTTGGNSGSAVLNEATGEAIGIHTNAGCSSGGGANWGCAIHNAGLQNALANPQGVCGGDVWTVDVNGGGDFTSIQAAINNAVGGDEIIVAPGVYTSLQEGHVVDMQGKTIWLHSSDGADVTAIDGNNARRGIYCGSGETSDTVIEGFTITNGLSVGFDYNGNGIIDGAEDDGGGVCCYYESSPTLINCIITNNHGTTGGGGISCRLGCNVSLIDCVISDNVDDQVGGGIWCRSSYPTISGCIISNNTSEEPGGGIRVTSGTPTMIDTYICGNNPDQIFGNWSDAGGNVIEEECFFIPTGACCLADLCSVEEEDGCNAVGGVYRGDESSCIGDSCIGDTVWTVDDDGGAEFTSIQDAINASLNGDEVLVSPGTYTGSGNNVVDLLGKSIVLRSSDGSGVTFIDGEGLRRVILCDKGETTLTTIDGFTIRNGSATAYPDWFSIPLHLGGGMLVQDSSPIVTNCIFEDNIATGGNGGYGGAVFTGSHVGASNLTLTDCYFANNSTDNSGGAVYLYLADCEMTHCTVRDNIAGNGGGLYLDLCLMTLNNSLICGNNPNQINGPWIDGGGNTVEDICGGAPTGACCVGYDCAIVNEMDCEALGGGYLGNSSSCLSDPCSPPSNTWTVGIGGGTDFDTIQEAVYMAVNGDEIIVMPGTYTSTGDNVVDMMGKSIYMRSSNGAAVTIIDGEFERRGIVYGYAEHPISLEGFTIQNCVATPYNWDGSGNYIHIGGGLLITDADIDVSGCSIVNNVAQDGSGWGGGVFVNSQMVQCDATFAGCTITQNYADREGGGVYDYKSILTFVNCTIDLNSSFEGGGGMGLSESNASFTDCVISNNIAGSPGGGLLLLNSVPTLVNTTVCGNNPSQIDGDWIDNGGNIIEIECLSICPGDINTDDLVNVIDLLIVIDQWGQDHSPADINSDGIVDVSDLLIIVGNWGSCEG